MDEGLFEVALSRCGDPQGYPCFGVPHGRPLRAVEVSSRTQNLIRECPRKSVLPDQPVLLLLGVPDQIVDAIMGWEPGGAARMRARYMHVTDPMLKSVARQVGKALWGDPGGDGGTSDDGSGKGPADPNQDGN